MPNEQHPHLLKRFWHWLLREDFPFQPYRMRGVRCGWQDYYIGDEDIWADPLSRSSGAATVRLVKK